MSTSNFLKPEQLRGEGGCCEFPLLCWDGPPCSLLGGCQPAQLWPCSIFIFII